MDLGFVVTTELVVLVVLAPLDSDAVEVSVSAIMTVTTETVVQQLSMPVLFAPLKLVDLAPPGSLAAPVDNVLLSLLVM